MVRAPQGRGPSPRDEVARRRETDQTPWLDEGDYDDESRTHTLVGRRALWGMLFGLGVLTLGVVVGILLVSRRDDAPIDVPQVGDELPILASPGPWKVPPSGPDVDGIPVEGQGQVLFGTGDGQDPEAQIALDSLPETPMPRPLAPGQVDETLLADAPPLAPETAGQPGAATPAAPAARPAETRPKPAVPKVIVAPEPQPSGGGGQLLQLGAFSSEGRARQAWKAMAGRLSYLEGLEPLISPVATDGKTLYRLRIAPGSAAAARDICGRLKVAGEACTVVN